MFSRRVCLVEACRAANAGRTYRAC